MLEILSAWDTVRWMRRPTRVTTHCLTAKESGTAAMQEKPTQTPCPNLTCCAEDSPARLSALLAIAEDLTTQEGPCSLSLPGWLKPGTLRICCLKMCPACSAITAAGHLQPSSIRWTDWGILWKAMVKRFLGPSTSGVLSLPQYFSQYDYPQQQSSQIWA